MPAGSTRPALATVAVAAGRPRRRGGEPLSVPPVLASVLQAEAAVEYGRNTNATWTALEEAVGALEGGTGLVFASGMAAVAAVMEVLADPGGPIVVPHVGYGLARVLAHDLVDAGRFDSLRQVDVTDTAATLAACDGAVLCWLESPTNPLLGIADLPAVSAGARARGVRVAVDNTLATPVTQRPLEHGADVVVHSITKFLAGHSDLLLGAAVTADDDLHAALATYRTRRGSVAGPLETWLALRGLRTLDVRVQRAQASALVLASRLAGHPLVRRVRYPGLATDPGHRRARAHMDGFGAMLAFEVGGGLEVARAVCRALRVAVYATSLGGVETTMEPRARQPGEDAVPDGLIRVSVGCEAVDDLWADLAQALEHAGSAP